MRTPFLTAALLVLSAPLSACVIHIPDQGPVEMRWVTNADLGPDERDWNSPCEHFGNVTPFSDKPVHRC